MSELINVAWVARNPERYNQLLQHGPTCPICQNDYAADNPALSPLTDGGTTCTHWVCENCALRIKDDKCPFCRACWKSCLFGLKVSYGGGGVDTATLRSYVAESAVVLHSLRACMDEVESRGSTDLSAVWPFDVRLPGLLQKATEILGHWQADPVINGGSELRSSGG